MPITLPSYVAPNELIQSVWGNAVVNALNELDVEKLDEAGGTITGALTVNGNLTSLAAFVTAGQQAGVNALTRKDYVDDNLAFRVAVAGDDMTGTLNINPSGSTIPLTLRNGSDAPSLRFFSVAGTDMASILVNASGATFTTLGTNPLAINAPTTIEHESGSLALKLKASTETPQLDLQSTAGTSLLKLTAATTTSTIEAFDDMKLRVNAADCLTLDGGTQRVTAAAALEIDGALDHDGTTVGFYGTAPIAKQTGVAVTAAGVHAALVALGLIT